MKPTESEEFARDYARLMASTIIDKSDPLFPLAVKQTTDSLLGYRKLLIAVVKGDCGCNCGNCPCCWAREDAKHKSV